MVTPEIHEVGERFTAMRRQVIHPSDIGLTIGRGSTELRAELVAAGVEVDGPAYARYHSWERDSVDIEVGFEVAAPVDLDGVQNSTLTAGREAIATHHGAYASIPKTFGALEAWVAEHEEVREVGREVYLSDPDTVPMAERITEIVIPIV